MGCDLRLADPELIGLLSTFWKVVALLDSLDGSPQQKGK
jgi:hypothetical protein